MKGRKHKGTGGSNDAEEDVKEPAKNRNVPNPITSEAEEKKRGGRAKKAHGGEMKVEGKKGMMHAGRKPRKSGGRSTSDANPFTSARKGSDPPGRKVMKGELGMGED